VNRREIILDATAKAFELHKKMNSMDFVHSKGAGIDVFGTIQNLSIPFLFQPLDKLLGAYLPPPYDGMVVTSERNLAIQRFTASHELGHKILKHKISLDDDSILERLPFGREVYNLDESAADAFAAAFLIPEWIFEIHAERQDWDAESLVDPRNVYQLSLRIGASYRATCRQLYQYSLIDRITLQTLIDTSPKKIKQSILDGINLPNWHPNVWLLTNRDEGMLLQGGPTDVFLLRLKENSGSGYLWNIDELQKSGFVTLADVNEVPDFDEEIGGCTERFIATTSETDKGLAGNLRLEQFRPWDASSVIEAFELDYELLKESGLPLAARRALV
jgi:Zn-dependent peptidase ImmA (M78 family)/predicted secreted protein